MVGYHFVRDRREKYMNKKKNTIINKIIKLFLLLLVIWILVPYVEVEYLTRKYGKYFEEGYRQSMYFLEDPYMEAEILRYKDEKARIYTDSKLVKMAMDDKREDIAIVCYGSMYVLVFQEDNGNWKLDTMNGKGEYFIVLQSATTSNFIWPYYF